MEVWAAAKDFETTLSRGTAGGLLSLFIEGALFFSVKSGPTVPRQHACCVWKGWDARLGQGRI